MSRHFIQRVRERLDARSARRLLALLSDAIEAGLVPPDGYHSVEGFGTAIVKNGTFVTFLDPEMVF